MRVETSADRLRKRQRSDKMLAAAQERFKEAQRAAQEKEDGFLRMCEINHREAVERDTIVTVIPTTPPEISTQCVAPQESNDGEFMRGIANGMLMGSAAMGLVVVLLKAAGVM